MSRSPGRTVARKRVRSPTASSSEQTQQLIQKLLDRRTAQFPGWRPMAYHKVLAKWDAAFFDAYNRWYEQCVFTNRVGGIDQVTRELIILAVASAVRDETAVAVRSRRAREMGIPVEKVFDCLAVAGLLAGLPAMRDALRIVSKEYRYTPDLVNRRRPAAGSQAPEQADRD